MLILFCWFLVGSIAGTVIGIVLAFLLGMFVPQEVIMSYSMIVIYPISFLPAMVYVARKSQNNSLFETGYKLNSSNFGPWHWVLVALVTVVLTLAMMIFADLPNYLNYQITVSVPILSKFYDYIIASLDSMTGGPFWSSFLVTAIFAPIFEEWLCRGMILRGLLTTKMKPIGAIIVSAMFFALLHMNPWQALNAFIIGMVMGYVYYKTGNLFLTMLIHFVNNGLAVVFANIPALSEYDYMIDMLGKQNYAIAYVLSIAILIGCYFFFKRIPLKHEWGNIDEVTLPAE